MLEIRNCKYNEYENICDNLQKGLEKGLLGVRKSYGGCYPVPIEPNMVEWIISKITNTKIPKDRDTVEGMHFNAQVIPFFTENARNSLRHKKASLKALHFLKDFFLNVLERKAKIEAAIDEINQYKSESFTLTSPKKLTKKLRHDKETYDFTFFCEDSEIIRAHWCVLKDIPFFKNRSSEIWAEKIRTEKTCDLTQFPKESVDLLLDILYKHPISEDASLDHLLWVYALSDFMDLGSNIKSFIETALQKRFNNDPSSFADALSYAFKAFEYPSVVYSFLESLEPDWDLMSVKNLKKLTEILILKAIINNPSALCYLGLCYENGLGIEKDLHKAYESYATAADQGLAPAKFKLAIFFEEGLAVEKDLAKAVELYTEAADQGHAGAQNNLAIYYDLGQGVEANLSKAIELFNKSAKQGNAAAQTNLAICYENIEDGNKDIQKAFELYTQAANQGFVRAQYLLACFYLKDNIFKNKEKAIELLEKAAGQGHKKSIAKLKELK